MSAPLNLTVELGTRSYPIWIGAGLLDDATRWRAALRGRHVLIVSNDVVAPLYLDRVVASLNAADAGDSAAPRSGDEVLQGEKRSSPLDCKCAL